MIDIANDIHSLTDFKRRTAEFLEKLRATTHPLVLTINGKAALVVQDAESYQRLAQLAEQAETLAGIREGLESMKRGEGKPADQVVERIRRKHRILHHSR